MLFFNGLKGEEAFGAKPEKEVDLVPDYEIIDAPDFDYEVEVVTEGSSIEHSQSKSGGRETEPAPSTSSAEKNVEMEEETNWMDVFRMKWWSSETLVSYL